MPPSNIKKVHSRVTTGCLCCRKKKIKCDEAKPTCKNCIKSSFICEWSIQKQTIQSLSQFKPQKIKRKLNKFINVNDALQVKKTSEHKKVSQPQPQQVNFQNDHASISTIPAICNTPTTHTPILDILPEQTKDLLIDTNNEITDTEPVIDTPIVPTYERLPSDIGILSPTLEYSQLSGIQDLSCVKEINPHEYTESFVSSKLDESLSQKQDDFTSNNQLVHVPNKKKQKDDDVLFRDYLKYLGEKSLPFKNNELSNLNMSSCELRYFDAFLNGFMVAVSPQLAHEKLQPISVILPRGIFNSTLRDVFYACGATYLSWNRKELKSDAEIQFKNCMNSIKYLINNNNDLHNNEDLLLIITTSFCLRERYQCEDNNRNSLFIIASLRIIYYLIERKTRSNNDSTKFKYFDQENLKSELNEIFDYLSTTDKMVNFSKLSFTSVKSIDDAVDNTIVNKELSTKDDLVSQITLSSNGEISPFERTMVESFIYNYCINLLSVDKNMIKYIESPFQVFQDMAPFLTHQIYDTPVKWMNNPIMGASLPAFELVAKSNWLRLKFPLNDKYFTIAKNLQKIAKFYTAPFLPGDVKFNQPKQIQNKLLESCYIGSLTAKACYILLTKLLYPNYAIASLDINEALDLFYKNLKKINLRSQAGALCLWPFVIAGLATSNLDDRKYLLYRIDETTELKKSEAMIRLKNFLLFHWENHENPNDIWNAMLEPSAFKDLFI